MSDTFHDLLMEFTSEAYEFATTGRAPRSHPSTALSLTRLYDEAIEQRDILSAECERLRAELRVAA